MLTAVLEHGRALDEALARSPALPVLEARDRAFARALATTVLRRLGRIDRVLDARLDRPPPARVRTLLRLGAAQLLFLETPPHAAVGETVDLARADGAAARFGGLINAVLRGVARDGEAALAGLTPAEDWPAWLMQSWRAAYGVETAAALAAASGRQAPLDITVKGEQDAWAARLEGMALGRATVRLAAGGDVAALPGFEDGAWWVQDAAAALPAQLLLDALGDVSGDAGGARVLDLCAAPGGKTLQLAAAGCAVTALDRSAARLKRVEENLARTGLSARIAARDGREAPALAAAEGVFDAALVDAPCSATGTLRRRPDVAWAKTPKDVAALAAVQADLLAAAAQAVRPGGVVVFCTCSLQPEEGAPVIAAAQAAGAPLAVRPIVTDRLFPFVRPADDGTARTFPHLPARAPANGAKASAPATPEAEGGDGFFLAVLERLERPPRRLALQGAPGDAPGDAPGPQSP